MDTTFPFGFPLATAFYLTLFVVTLVLHVLFMNYVLSGTAWLAWSIVSGRVRLGRKSAEISKEEPATSESILADWIPTMLSGAITAGVAPLLFVQILYQREFYTANLLLFNRWMSILPVLIVGFYSLYVLRSNWLTRRSALVKTLTGLLPFLCVAFVAYSWTENHLLSVNSPEQWRAFYAEGKEIYFEPQIIPRLAVWGLGSIATACVWLAWQFRYRAVHHLPVDSQSISRLPKIALFGLIASIVCGIAYYFSAPHLGAVFLGPMARWYLAAAILGMIAQLTGWFQLLRQIPSTNGISLKPLLLTTAGLVVTVLGMSVCREAIRLLSLGATRLQELIPQHAEAMKVEGFWVFLLFAVINIGLISWCFWLVKKNYIQTGNAESAEVE
jgi:hypothetical protein